MQWRNSTERWGAIAQLLHWLIALAVFSMFVIGWVMVAMRISPAKLELYSLHKSLGVTILLLVAIRLAWRLFNITPSLAALPDWERTAATANHWLLYILIIGMVISGYLINSATNFPLVVWGVLPLPNITPESEPLEEIAEGVHLTLFWLLALLVTLHVAASLRHHWLLKDDMLRRMLPRLKRGERR